ncbi:biotin-dependent carboxyltransferase family protein [Alkalihalobacillus deserti]|uniref:5-oxoprolinase subunit C family protein n=1 Tax=Alkalihalobacillus deserti TaxID=2879466 RepID=UPI001D15A638|nr:biotin-dependent carboxyltransferase family protein [Alkalihalobacillus deserti]
MALTILKPGLLTTIQDLGRIGYQKHGIIISGAMDSVSLRLANLLVGNEEDEGVLELTLSGPTLRFEKDTLIAITGGDLSPTINQKEIPLSKAVHVKKGSVLTFGPSKYGCRSYLACAGGFQITKVFGSMSTYLRASLGGFHGRALKQGDVIELRMPSQLSKNLIQSIPLTEGRAFQASRWTMSQALLPSSTQERGVRLIKGPQFSDFTKVSQEVLWSKAFKISPQSDRMGCRLEGEPLRLEKSMEVLSEPVTLGTIQVPPDGNPIILLADRQTIGGYPKVAQVAAVDLPIIAQAKPGDQLFFKEILLEEAEQLYLQREKDITHLKTGLYLKGYEL